MNADLVREQIEQSANDVLNHLRQSTKNIEWSMDIDYIKWDAQVKIKGSYLDCVSWVHSPSIDLGRAMSNPDWLSLVFGNLGDYVLHTTIQQLARELFER